MKEPKKPKMTNEQLDWELVALKARVGLLHEFANCIAQSVDDLCKRRGQGLDSVQIGHVSDDVRALVMSRRGISSRVAEMIDRGEYPR